jgi:long-subunit acyl-CoA synthetase (AMP-forming)
LFKAYGMTETTGGHALNNERGFRFEAVGRKREGIHTKIVHPDEDGQGEV